MLSILRWASYPVAAAHRHCRRRDRLLLPALKFCVREKATDTDGTAVIKYDRHLDSSTRLRERTEARKATRRKMGRLGGLKYLSLQGSRRKCRLECVAVRPVTVSVLAGNTYAFCRR